MSRPRSRGATHAVGAREVGFTLIEVLGAIFLTSLVVAVAVTAFVNLSSQSTRAVEMMREGLHSTAVLERITSDLSGASLLVRKSEDIDPHLHPWHFTAASQYAFGGADALKFISRSQRPRVGAMHVSDLAQVAYFTTVEEDGSTTLHRWSAPSLPPSYEPGFPRPDDPGSFVLADGLGGVTFRFRTEEGEWVDEWDSKQIIQSDQLPSAVEVSVYPFADEPDFDGFDGGAPAHVRQIVLHQRPIDLTLMIEEQVKAQEAALAAAGAAGEDEDGAVELDEDGKPIPTAGVDQVDECSVAQIVSANMAACTEQFGRDNCLVWSNVNNLPVSSFGVALPWSCP